MLSGCKPQYCKTVGYTWLYSCDRKAFGSNTRFGDLKIGAGIEAMHAVGLQNTYEQKGAMVRDSNSLQSSCKADAALVDHVRLRSCFISPPFPSPPMHVTGRTRGESNPTVTQLPPGYISLKIDHGGHPIQLGKCLKMVRFEATAPRTPYSHFVRKEQLQPSLTAGFRN